MSTHVSLSSIGCIFSCTISFGGYLLASDPDLGGETSVGSLELLCLSPTDYLYTSCIFIPSYDLWPKSQKHLSYAGLLCSKDDGFEIQLSVITY